MPKRNAKQPTISSHNNICLKTMAAGIQFSDTDGNPSHRPDGSLGYILAPHEAETDYRSKIGKLVAPKLTGYKPGMSTQKI